MNTETGEIKLYTPSELKEVQEQRVLTGQQPLLELKGVPKSNCRHCYGRGYTGLNIITNQYEPCRCVV